MASIQIIDAGQMDNRDSAYPQAVQLPDGDILCSFSVGGGPNATGGTDYCRSKDGGKTWQLEGTILPPTNDPHSTNFLKVTLSKMDNTIFAYGARSYRKPGDGFGHGRNEPIFCTSTDHGHTWSAPQIIPMPYDCTLEISSGIVALKSGRLLAPAATLPAKDRLGEKVYVAISDDNGGTWNANATVFQDPNAQLGYFEHKFTEYAPGKIMATCWTIVMKDVSDRPDSFVTSSDNGKTWGKAYSTGIQGQTMTPISLGDNRLLVMYNRRYGRQGIVMCLVTFDETSWQVHTEQMLYDPQSLREKPTGLDCGVDEFSSFAFGFPTGIQLNDGTILATYWAKMNGSFGIGYARLKIEW